MPIAVRASEPTRNKSTKPAPILLAFPAHPKAGSDPFSVYAFFPVCNVGLQFLINSGNFTFEIALVASNQICIDWVVVTNRESISGERPWNQYLMHAVARFFIYIVLSNASVRTHVGVYTIVDAALMSIVFCRFLCATYISGDEPLVGRIC